MLLELYIPTQERFNYCLTATDFFQHDLESVHMILANMTGFIAQMGGTIRKEPGSLMFYYRGDKMSSVSHRNLKRIRNFPFPSEDMREYCDRTVKETDALAWTDTAGVSFTVREYCDRTVKKTDTLVWTDTAGECFNCFTDSYDLLMRAYGHFRQINFSTPNWSALAYYLYLPSGSLCWSFTQQFKLDQKIWKIIPQNAGFLKSPLNSNWWYGQDGYEHLVDHRYSPCQCNYPVNIHYPFTEQLVQFLLYIEELRKRNIELNM